MADLRPRVTTKRNILSSLQAPAGARNAAMICSAQWGPINEVTNISSLSQFIDSFGSDNDNDDLTGIKGADLFFANGGTLKVVRVDDGTASEASLVLQSDGTDVITLTAKYKGTAGNDISIEISENGTNRNIELKLNNTTEIFTNVGDGYSTNEAIVNAINENSNLVTATVETGEETQNLVDAITATYLETGSDGTTSLESSDYSDVITNQLLLEEYDYLLIPGVTDNSAQNIFVGNLNARAVSEQKYSRYITGGAVDETIASLKARTLTGLRATLVAPNVKYTNRVTNNNEVLDGSYLACVHAGLLCRLDLEISATHETPALEGLSVNVSTGKEFYTKAEQSELLSSRITPYALVGRSLQCIRAVTRHASTTDPRFEQVIVDIVDYVQVQLETYLNSVIGKPNTQDNRNVYAARMDALLQTIQDEGIIQSFDESIVNQGASPDTINAQVAILPAYSTNFVNLTINIQ